jgi:hypothetical protein
MLDKVDRMIDRIGAVRRGAMPESDAMAALDALTDRFQKHRQQLHQLDDVNSAVVDNHCDIILLDLFRYLPHLGFLYRARHPSNPFEIHGPLKRLAQQVIDADVRLIISSEWEFSPYTHPTMGDIPNFVLLGLPASEADNALLVPIAGHEFGHPIWKRQQLGRQFAPRIERAVFDSMRARLREIRVELGLADDEDALRSDPRAIAYRSHLTQCVQSQAEEVFCDLVGVFTFGESYCHAFTHLLAPGLVGFQSDTYPSARRRAAILEQAAARFGTTALPALAGRFREHQTQLWDDVMNTAVDEIVDDLMGAVETHMASRGVAVPGAAGRARASHALELAMPAAASCTLPEIMCAGFDLVANDRLWASTPYLRSANERGRLINDLILKSTQVADYWYCLEPRPC